MAVNMKASVIAIMAIGRLGANLEPVLAFPQPVQLGHFWEEVLTDIPFPMTGDLKTKPDPKLRK